MIARDPSAEEASPAAPALPDPPSTVAPEVLAVLKERFGFDGFRDGQEAVVAAVLAERDVLCVMPTGAGKSLCFQLPALVLPGITLVVSPLISLMQDQVASLQRRDIAAAAINSAVPLEEQDAILDDAASGALKLLYVAPERFRNERFRRRLSALSVSLIAVDEAHCISQWGHDFRPDYRRLAAAIELCKSPPVLALTATAPPEVQDDVVKQLGLPEPVRLLHGLVRDNLAYHVVQARARDAKNRHLLHLARIEDGGATLIYAATRKSVERITDVLRDGGLDAERYHAGLSDEERARTQDRFLSGRGNLLVATNAFGMGVDRPDIRRVIHYEIPRTAEAYVQETGRAGRDGKPATCTLLYSAADLHIQRFFLESSNPSKAVVVEVFRVLRELGQDRIELTADGIAQRMHIETTGKAVGAALAILDRASVVRRGKRGDNLARVTVLPSAGELFHSSPLPPGLSRLMAHLIRTCGFDVPSSLDTTGLAEQRGVTEETIRRGLRRLEDLGRIDYVPPFRGRATELRASAFEDDTLDAVDFDLLEAKRAHEEAKLEEMIQYATTRACRTQTLLGYFGVENAPRCGRCDRCDQRARPEAVRALRAPDAESNVRHVLEAVRAYDKRYGFGKLAGHLAGSRADGIAGSALGRGPTYGVLGHLGTKGATQWLRIAEEAGLLRLVQHRLRGNRRMVHLVALSPAGLRVLKGGPMPDLQA